MQVNGLTSSLAAEADQKFQGGFRAWLGELKRGCWSDWAELLSHYPDARRTVGNQARFPLAADGGGIEAAVSFPVDPTRMTIIRLLRVCPSVSAAARPPRAGRSVRAAGHKLSMPPVR